MSEIIITEKNFENEVLKSELPVLIDFYATWCQPCSMMAPVVSEIAEEYAGKLKVGKVDIDRETELAIRYGIMSIPAFVMFKGGEAVGTVIGVSPKEEILEML